MVIKTDRQILITAIVIAVLSVLLVCVLVLVNSANKRQSSDYQLPGTITLERGPCFGFCPVYKVSISSEGKVEFEGIDNVTLEGKITYTISQAEARKLFTQAETLKFFELKDSYKDDRITDLDSATITLKAGSKTKSVYMYGFAPQVPQDLKDFAALIDQVASVEKYVKYPIVVD